MSFYYKEIQAIDHKTLIQVIRDSFETVSKELEISEGEFTGFGAFYTKEHLNYDLSKGSIFIGAYTSKEERLVGCVGVLIKKEQVARIVKLSVLASYRHMGIGKELMFEAECYSFNRNCKQIEFGLIHDNHILYQWYLDLGYKVGKVRPYKNSRFRVAMMSKAYHHLYELLECYGFDYLGRTLQLSDSCNFTDLCRIQFGLIYSPSEVRKPTNTGMLSQKVFGSVTREIVWHRKDQEGLERFIETFKEEGNEVILLHKKENSDKVRKLSRHKGAKRAFLILDATWQEAQHMYNHSEVLQALPCVAFFEPKKSRYTLRRNQVTSGLCTAEVMLNLIEIALDPIEYERCVAMVHENINSKGGGDKDENSNRTKQ